MNKTFFLPSVLGLAVCIAICLAGCKKEPDLPADPHVPLVNPFTGVWNAGGEHWHFRADGTGGRAETGEGPFLDDFGFFVYAGQDVQTVPSEGTLVLLDDSGDADINVISYDFSVNNNQVTLTSSGQSMTLQRVSGAPSALSLTNPLIGEWSAQWTGTHDNNTTWSFKYRTDGTVKAYHHGSHQFENGYALRGNTLVVFGILRFRNEVIAEIHNMENGGWQASEKQVSPPPADWVYTKVAAAEWK
jgi:hypothetical protein